MRYRLGNPFRDQHGLGWSMQVYDFVAQATEPHSVSLCIESLIPELVVYGRGTVLKERIWLPDLKCFVEQTVLMQDYDPTKQGRVNGAVWTSWGLDLVRDEPCLYIALGLYMQPCSNKENCIAGHKGYLIEKAPSLDLWQLDAIKEEIGEHPRLKLGVRQDKDESICKELGLRQIGPARTVELGATG